MKEQILEGVFQAIKELGIDISGDQKSKITVTTTNSRHGDFATNAAFIIYKGVGVKNILDTAGPVEFTEILRKLIEKNNSGLYKVEMAGAGFINFRLKNEFLVKNLLEPTTHNLQPKSKDKILLEYFQPNIAKPLHIGHLRTAIIGDTLKRMMKFANLHVESDNHLGDWGTQFGVLILAFKRYGKIEEIIKDPINELNKLYVRMNEDMEKDKSLYDQAKQEFVLLEQKNPENLKIWKKFSDWSLQNFERINDTLDLLPFEHQWPESFYEDKMPNVLESLKAKKVLKESQGAQIVDLEDQKLGIAVIVKSDGGTTYLLRDLATYLFAKKQGFEKHLYVVDSRQSLHYDQLRTILKLLDELNEENVPYNAPLGHPDRKLVHIDYGFISFKGAALSTRKGNMVLAEDVLAQACRRVAKIIKEKNPALADKEKVIQAVAIGAIKYFDLSHNRHSDYEFDWDEALDFEGNSGPYIQYAYARLSGILTKVNLQGSHKLDRIENISLTEHELMVKLLGLEDTVSEALKDYMPNLLANYLYELAAIVNKFYHESPVMKEDDAKLKFFRLMLIKAAREKLGTGLNLLGIEALDEM